MSKNQQETSANQSTSPNIPPPPIGFNSWYEFYLHIIPLLKDEDSPQKIRHVQDKWNDDGSVNKEEDFIIVVNDIRKYAMAEIVPILPVARRQATEMFRSVYDVQRPMVVNMFEKLMNLFYN